MSIRLHFICSVAVVLAMGSASAAESGWYVGLNAGSVSSKAEQFELNTVRTNWVIGNGSYLSGSPVTTNVDGSDRSFSTLVGYSLSRHVSVEAAYVDLGVIRYHYSGQFAFGSLGYTRAISFPFVPPVLYPGQSEIAWDHSAATLKLIGRIPFANRFDVHGQLGVAFTVTKVRWATSVYSNPARDLLLEDESERMSQVFGVGGAFNISQRLTLSLDWQRYAISEDEQEPLDLKMDSDAITLAILFRFGVSQ